MKYKTIQVNKKQIRLHRYIMECFLGRKLLKNEIIHHIDGNKFNNNISNLEVLTRSEHIKKHFDDIKILDNQFKKVYNIDADELMNLYADTSMTHNKLADIFKCSTGTIARILGKKARGDLRCKVCGEKAVYIKKMLCKKHYLKEYYNERNR